MAKIQGVQYTGGWTVTYYDPALGGINTNGDPTTTATGKFRYFQSMAVDPKVIPYGSIVHVHIPDYPQYDQFWLAADTGGAIKGKHVDLGLPKSAGFGKVTNAEIAIIYKGKGPSDAREKAANWDSIIKQLATEKGLTSYLSQAQQSYSLEALNGANEKADALGGKFEYTDPTMIRGKSPNVEDDDYPEHRYASNPFVLRIGDAQFFIPPVYITTEKVSMIDGTHAIRSKTQMLVKSGYTQHRITIQMVFGDVDQINGWKVKAPQNKTYYMDGLRSLIAQFYRNPVLPIRNELLNDRYGIFNVALEQIRIITDSEIPNYISCELRLLECTVEPFLSLPDYMYDYVFNYPLWRWYYQQMLIDDRNNVFSNTYLKPINKRMNGQTFFRVLSPTEISKMQEDVIQKAQAAAANSKDNKDYYLNPDYILYRFKTSDIYQLMTDWDIGNAICLEVGVEINKTLTPIHMEDYEQPCYQDIGGMVRKFAMRFYCTNRDELESLQHLVKHAEMTARDYRHRFAGGFVAIDNEIVNLAGIYFAMPIGIESETIPEIDDNYYVTIYFQEFDVNQKNNERLQGVNYSLQQYAKDMNQNFHEIFALSDKRNRKPEIIYEDFVENALAQLELYPDLELPTIEDANKALKAINEYRQKRGQSKLPISEFPKVGNSYWVEPDFYMVYPNIDDAYEAIGIGEMGMKIANLIANKDNSYVDLMAEEGPISSVSEFFDSLSVRFKENALHPAQAQEILSDSINLELDWSLAAIDAVDEAFQDWNEKHPIPEKEQLLPMMLHDMVLYGNRYRMTKMFPTYMLLFVDEGQWVDGRRLWNNHYAYHSIEEISIVRDKDNPVDLAFIRLTNIYGTFNYTSKMIDPRKLQDSYPKTIKERFAKLWDSFNLDVEDVMAERYNLLETATLKEGARVHIRMGYSSNACRLPICFNGHIAEVNDGPIITIVAQGDGAELISRPLSFNPQEGTPNEPHNAFLRYLTARQSNYWFSVSAGFEFFNNYESRYGIEHFGWVESLAGDGSDMTTIRNIVESFYSKAYKWIRPGETLDKEEAEEVGIAVAGFFDGVIIDNVNFVLAGITGIPNFNTYDIMKNIYRGAAQPQTGVIEYEKTDGSFWERFVKFVTNMYHRWNVFDGEKNANFSVFNKTLWDIGQQYAMFVPEFICAPHHHGLRSTLFFGMPHWPVKYAYVKKDGTSGLEIDHYQEKYKPFQQFHVFVSGNDIIKNNIKASSEHIKHVATGIYFRGDINTIKDGITVYADRSIMSSDQKAMLVDTGVYQDLFGPDAVIQTMMNGLIIPILTEVASAIDLVLDTGNSIIDKVIDKVRSFAPGFTQDFLDWFDKKTDDAANMIDPDKFKQWLKEISNPGEYASLSVTIGALQRSMMEMYQGELVVFGYPAAKPWDIFFLSDLNLSISGTAQIGKITHTLSRSTGFTSTIKPDLIVGRVEGQGGHNWVMFMLAHLGTFIGVKVGRRILRSRAMKWVLKGSAGKSWSGAKKITKATSYLTAGKRGVRVAQSFFEKAENLFDTVKSGKIVRTVGTAMRTNIFLLLVSGFIADKLTSWYDKETKYNNVLYIYPLWKYGEPFVAGIRGAAHIIPNYIDPRYADPLGMSGDWHVGMNTSSTNTPYDTTVEHPLGRPSVITSHYGPRWGTMHYGTDLAPFTDSKGKKITTSIYSIANGTVIYNGYGEAEGYWVQIKHNVNGEVFISVYKHMKSKSSLQVGQTVSRGQFIGYMGNTGDVVSSTGDGTHLHFEIVPGDKFKYGKQVNPVTFMKKFGVTL